MTSKRLIAKWFFIKIICIVSINLSRAQDDLPAQINVIPPSPDVMAMNKYVDIPVSHYTGTPEVSVPIYEIKMQQLSLPISLSYHASGLKVEEYASWVGAGWVLNAGGNINRTVRGLPDEYLEYATNTEGRKGYFYNDKMYTSSGDIDTYYTQICDNTLPFPTAPEYDPITTVDSIASGMLDMEPDLYRYSFPGSSGKFVYTRNGTIVKYEADDNSISQHPFSGTFPVLNNSSVLSDYEWTIESADGTVFSFKNAEETTTNSACGELFSGYDDPVNNVQSTWHLDKISLGGEWIQFYYVEEVINYDLRTTTSGKYRVSGTIGIVNGATNCFNTQQVQTQRLDKITTSNGYEIKFVAATSDRDDLTNSHSLEKIEIKKDGILAKSFKLNYSYFGSNTKLKLNSVEQFEGTNTLPGYEFTYFSGVLPSITSNAQDYWGFHNGAWNTALIPTFKNTYAYASGGADRSPQHSSALIGTLQKITYPTGGYSEFTYEQHDHFTEDGQKTYIYEALAQGGTSSVPITDVVNFSVSQGASFTISSAGNFGLFSTSEIRKWNGSSYVPFIYSTLPTGNRHDLPVGNYQLFAQNGDGGTNSIKVEFEQTEDFQESVGGLRILNIETYDPASQGSIKREYEYKLENGNSSGKLFTPPLLGGEIIRHTDGTGAGLSCNSTNFGTYVTVHSANQLPASIYSGSHIGYSRVVEYQAKGLTKDVNGKTVYEFINDVGALNLGYPFVPQNDLAYKNGKLLKQAVFSKVSSSLVKIKETINTYGLQVGTTLVKGLKLAPIETRHCYSCNTTDYQTNIYSVRTNWHYLISSEEINYDDNQEALSVLTSYAYNTTTTTHHLPISKSFTDSKGDVYTTEFSRLSGSPALITAANTYQGSTKISGQSFTYHGKLPATIAQWDGLTTGSVDIQKMRYSFGTESTLKEVEQFPVTGGAGIYGTKSAYIWGYANAYPIAEATNADFDDIAFSSFEGSHKGNWAYMGYVTSSVEPFSGSKYYQLNTGNVTKSSLTSSIKYVVSYWAKDGTTSVTGVESSRNNVYTNSEGWSFYEKIVTGVSSITISGTAKIDELRLYPLGAQMTTFTYRPGFGVSSQTAANGITTFYIYDNFGRLEMIKDMDGNILKAFEYAYQESIPSTQQN